MRYKSNTMKQKEFHPAVTMHNLMKTKESKYHYNVLHISLIYNFVKRIDQEFVRSQWEIQTTSKWAGINRARYNFKSRTKGWEIW